MRLVYYVIVGFPAVGVEFTYRNPRSEVVRFLEDRHADNYFVYNFCAEEERWYVRADRPDLTSESLLAHRLPY